MASDNEGRKITELRVIDLKAELEKRGRDKSGVKATLIEKLEKALREDGHDPETYLFDLTEKKTPKRLSISNSSVDENGEAESLEGVQEQITQVGVTDPEPMDVGPIVDSVEKKPTPSSANVSIEKSTVVSDVSNANMLQTVDSLTSSVTTSSAQKAGSSATNDCGHSSAKTDAANQQKTSDDCKDRTKKIDVSSTSSQDGETTRPKKQPDAKEDVDKVVVGKGETKKPDSTQIQDPESIICITIGEDEENMVLHDGNEPEGGGRSNLPKKDEKIGSSNVDTTTKDISMDENKAAGVEDNSQTNKPTAAGKATNESSCKTTGHEKEKFVGNGNSGRNLWVTNITQNTRATELKQVLSQYGRVIGAKVVTNARYPGARCYGYVTMETSADASNCIAKLNNTELCGQIICLEKVRPDQPAAALFREKTSEGIEKCIRTVERVDISGKSDPKKSFEKDKEESKKSDRKESISKDDNKSDRGKRERERDIKKESSTDKYSTKDRSKLPRRSRERERSTRDRASYSDTRRDIRKEVSSTSRKDDILTFDKIREERERQRFRERERFLREERRRREEHARHREIEHRQRQESVRLEREREKLRAEMDKIDRERADLQRLEREIEMERLKQEKLELQRVKMRLEEANRRPAAKRPATYRRESSYEDRKRSATDRHFDEAPPPPRFDSSVKVSRDSSPPMNKKPFGGNSKYYCKPSAPRSSGPVEKRESSSYIKHDRDFDTGDRTTIMRTVGNSGGGSSASKYDASAIYSITRDREIHDLRNNLVLGIKSSPQAKAKGFTDRNGGDRSPSQYRSVRDTREQRTVTDHKTVEMRSTTRDHGRYDPPNKVLHADRNSANWHSVSSSNFKEFEGPSGTSSSRDGWNKPESWRPADTSTFATERSLNINQKHIKTIAGRRNSRWSGSAGGGWSGMKSSNNATMSGNSGLGMGTCCPPPPGISNYNADRFDNYKTIVSNIRR